MPSQRDIRRRINASKNIRQITRAMQFVAASKLRRAQESTLAARPYSDLIDEILADLAAVLGADEHPLLSRRQEGKRLIILVTSDRGLAGPLNTNAVRFVSKEVIEHAGDLEMVTIGRKGRDAMRRARVPIIAHFAGFGDRPSVDDILPLARLISDEYEAGTYNDVDIVFTRFVSTLVQRADMVQLLPIRPSSDTHGVPGSQFIFEPAPEVVLNELLPRYLVTRLYQTALESTASFFSSQMVAMKSATENASELIDDLTLSYNKARQANITSELIEIASGAQAR
ncbi:MAG TPA: ATP synthase F1 subunit gamma [Terriglobales bacterium]|nr:ATP synthase F1 subunit gamma [Terriglobales bacterium]